MTINNKARFSQRDEEFAQLREEFATSGCLPETSDVEKELSALSSYLEKLPSDAAESEKDRIYANAQTALQQKSISRDVYNRVLAVLGKDNSEENKPRLHLVQG